MGRKRHTVFNRVVYSVGLLAILLVTLLVVSLVISLLLFWLFLSVGVADRGSHWVILRQSFDAASIARDHIIILRTQKHPALAYCSNGSVVPIGVLPTIVAGLTWIMLMLVIPGTHAFIARIGGSRTRASI